VPGCSLKAQCTKGQQRRITRWKHEEVVEAVQKRLDENLDAMRQRRETVEHPFGTLKMRMGATRFLMKTLPEGCRRDGIARARLQFDARHEHRRHQAADGGDRGLTRSGCNLCSAESRSVRPDDGAGLPPRPKSKKMLETVTLQCIPPAAVRRHPLRRVITRDPKETKVPASTICRVVASGVIGEWSFGPFRRPSGFVSGSCMTADDGRVARSASIP
jgi:hypothetical protein